jgi:hypothetical protein
MLALLILPFIYERPALGVLKSCQHLSSEVSNSFILSTQWISIAAISLWAFSIGLLIVFTSGYVYYNTLLEYFSQSITDLGPPTSFNFGQSIEKQVRKCLECGQPIEAQKYYIIERYNAVLMLPQEWDTNEELTGQATMELQSNTPVTITSSTLDKPVCSIETITPLCCHPTMEQAELLLCFTRLALKRRNIPCFIVPLEKDQLSLDKSLVSRCGSL